MTPTFMAPPWRANVASSPARDPPILDHRVGQELAGDALEGLVVDRVVHLQLEVFALAHVGHSGDPEAGERARHGLPLRIEDLRLRHDVHHHSGHGGAAYEPAGAEVSGRG